MKKNLLKPVAAAAAIMLAAAGLSAQASSPSPAPATAKTVYSLAFDASKGIRKTLTKDGITINYRAFENLVYVANPVDTKYQVMNIYVPEDYFAGKSAGGWTADTAPIFFPNGVGGYMPSQPKAPDSSNMPAPPAGMAIPAGAPPAGMALPGGGPAPDNSPNAIFVALCKGYVVASPGTRGRTVQDANGTWTGKAPAVIVDLKAAIRYLRLNDKVMPGNAEKIVSNGTSAGGAVSALLGASGNNKDYEPYLKALGAADARDDVFAVSSYCPITNLDNADMAYEWQFAGVNTYTNRGVTASLDATQIKVSAALKAAFPAYLNSLGLRTADGKALTLDAAGNGSFKDYLKTFIVSSAQKALAAGKEVSAQAGLTIKDGKVTDVDFEKYITYIGRMKATTAFDAFDASAAENSLFGTATVDTQHFTKTGMDNSTVKTGMADSTLIKMMNPMNYVGATGTSTAKNWRIRHGASDRDAGFAIALMLATRLQSTGAQVDYALPWAQGHGGDYDKDELFAWMAQVCK